MSFITKSNCKVYFTHKLIHLTFAPQLHSESLSHHTLIIKNSISKFTNWYWFGLGKISPWTWRSLSSAGCGSPWSLSDRKYMKITFILFVIVQRKTYSLHFIKVIKYSILLLKYCKKDIISNNIYIYIIYDNLGSTSSLPEHYKIIYIV